MIAVALAAYHLPVDAAALLALRASLRGEVLLPIDAAYEALALEVAPALAVLPRDEEDIDLAVAFARRHGLRAAVRGDAPADGEAVLLIDPLRMAGALR